MYRRQFFIGGTWADPSGGDRLGVVSPSTEEVVGEVPVATTADIDRAVRAARSAFDDGPWPRMAPAERAAVLASAATILRKRVARRLRTGSIAINGNYPPFPLVPFGGFRESGLGRELGPEGLRNFLEPRSIGLPASLRSGAA